MYVSLSLGVTVSWQFFRTTHMNQQGRITQFIPRRCSQKLTNITLPLPLLVGKLSKTYCLENINHLPHQNLDYSHTTPNNTQSWIKNIGKDDPLIILTFDKAHTLTDRIINGSSTWSNFSVLRHVLRALHHFSLFSPFLFMTGKITQFTSSSHEDVSARIIEGMLILIQPFMDIGFDTLAEAILIGNLKLEKIISDLHIAHLGRPLYVPLNWLFTLLIRVCIKNWSTLWCWGSQHSRRHY